MRLLSARLHGLIGVYSASGLKEIYIDFRKCLHNIILIIGKNGSGKTTIWEALQPIPLSTSKFIEKEPGLIELEYIHNDIIYTLRMEYPITNSRERAQTKAFIQKQTSDGEITELNPNGNIGSYKSALFGEFNLDPNFISLSQLSSEDMGIVSKKPSERKKFVASIVESIEVYNDIHKAISKRSTIFKSMINSISAKIDTIGNQETLLTSLQAIDNRLHRLNAERDVLVKNLAKEESMIKLTDPDNSIQEVYKKISSELYIIHQEMDGYEIYLDKIEKSFGATSLDKLIALHKDISDKLYQAKVDLEKNTSSLQDLLLSKEEESKYIQMKNARINSLKEEVNIDYIKSRMQQVTKEINDCELVFSKLNISKDTIITKDEFIHGVTIMNDIKEAISTVKSFSEEVNLDRVLKGTRDGYHFGDETNHYREEMDSYKERLDEIDKLLNKYYSLLELTKDLSKRPSNCKIDDCPFIKTALESFKQDPETHIKSLEEEKKMLTGDFEESLRNYKNSENDTNIQSKIFSIIRTIGQNATILNKFPTGKYLTDLNTFIDNFNNVIVLNEITNLQNHLYCANTFEQYKLLQSELKDLRSDYKIYESKAGIIDELTEELDSLIKKMSNIVFDIEEKRAIISKQNESKLELESRLSLLDNSIKILRERESKQERQSSLTDQVNRIANSISTIENSIKNINVINSNISNLEKEISPATQEKDKLVYSLKQLEEYNEELSVYNNKYSILEIIKKYSSPTKGGIQTLFMQLYMGKTISMANELLSLLFDGKFELLPYIINESEFRIPCVNKESSVTHDDISSCSSAERAMISMMISFSLLHHSSTVYNILRLDEIDGALDQGNRSRFLMVLDKFMKDLGVENCIMISHSSEMDMSNVDIIQLVPVDNTKPNGNIIFTYND